LKVWQIALVVIAGLLFLILLLVIVVRLHFKSKYSKSKDVLKENNGEREQINSTHQDDKV